MSCQYMSYVFFFLQHFCTEICCNLLPDIQFMLINICDKITLANNDGLVVYRLGFYSVNGSFVFGTEVLCKMLSVCLITNRKQKKICMFACYIR